MKKQKTVSFAFGDPLLPLTNMIKEEEKPKVVNVSGMLYEFGNAEIYDASDAEHVRRNAEQFASMIHQLLVELDETEIVEVRELMDKYGVIL